MDNHVRAHCEVFIHCFQLCAFLSNEKNYVFILLAVKRYQIHLVGVIVAHFQCQL